MVNLLSLFALMVSASLAAGQVVGRCGIRPSREPLAAAIAGLTLWVSWPLASALLVAWVAMFSGLALVQMPVVAAVSVAGTLVLLVVRDNGENTTARSSGASAKAILQRIWPGRAVFLMAVVPVAGLHTFLLAGALLRPPMSSDGVYYHLPLIGQWLRSGQLHMVPRVWAYCLPGNGEVWQLFFAGLGMEQLIEPAMLPVGLLCALIIAGLARALGASRPGAVICACLGLACPMVAMQMYGSYVDLFSAAFLLGSLYWVLRLNRASADLREKAGAAVLAGLSFGVSLGTRLMILGWAPLVVAALLTAAWRCSDARDRRVVGVPASVWSFTGLFVAGALLCSSYWYARNARETGWPLYPVSVRLFGHQFGEGRPADDIYVSSAARGWRTLAYPWLERKKNRGYTYGHDNGVGAVFAACALPGVAYLLARRARWARRRQRFADILVLACVAVGAGLFVKAFFSNVRYALPLWLMVFAAAGPLWSMLVRYRARAGLVLLGTATWLSVAMIALWPAKNLLGHLQEGDLSRSAWYGLPKSLETLPEGTVVLNMSYGPMNYALHGAKWQHEVIDTFMAGHFGLEAPLLRDALDRHRVEVVVARETTPPEELFGPGVCYEELRDPSAGAENPLHVRSRAYRVIRRVDERTVAGLVPTRSLPVP